MLKTRLNQTEFEFVCLEQLVPQDHLLRKIENVLDFEFIREKVRMLYSENNGRPSVDPVVLFKLLFIGYLFGIRSERQLIREVEMNMAYRWFLGYNLTEKIPNHSTISQNRRRRFSESNVYQEIFDHIVLQALELKLADGKHLYTDSTHLKANANNKKFKLEEVQKSTRSYLNDLEADVNQDRLDHGKAELKKK
jgi:transposase